MSAQALLSMIAPALPSVPQGTAGGDAASAFESLLAGMMGVSVEEEAAPPKAEEAKLDGATAMAGFLLAPAPPPPVTTPAPVGEDAEAAATPPGTGEAVPPDAEPVPTAPTAEAPLPKGAPVAEAQTQVQAAEAQADAQGVDEPTAVSPSADLTEAEVAAAIAAAAGDKEPAANAEAAPQPTPPAPTPPPLRPLVERTSKPLEATEGKPATDDASAPASPTATGVEKADAAGAATEPPAKAVEAPPPIAADTARADDGEARPETPAHAEAANGAQPAVPAREASVSTLSRSAIDATAQIAAQILKKLDGRSTRFEMALTPDDLGRVDVKLDIDSEGRLAARLAFDNPAAAADLRGRVDELRRQLEQSGFQLADDAFEFAERDQGSSAFDRGQDSRSGQDRAFAAAARLNADADAPLQAPRWVSLSLSPAGVDLKV